MAHRFSPFSIKSLKGLARKSSCGLISCGLISCGWIRGNGESIKWISTNHLLTDVIWPLLPKKCLRPGWIKHNILYPCCGFSIHPCCGQAIRLSNVVQMGVLRDRLGQILPQLGTRGRPSPSFSNLFNRESIKSWKHFWKVGGGGSGSLLHTFVELSFLFLVRPCPIVTLIEYF